MATECSICCEAINTSTGSVTLGCSHRYHLKCIITWSLESETCPYCRKAMNKYERIGEVLPEIPGDKEIMAATKIAAAARGFLTRLHLN